MLFYYLGGVLMEKKYIVALDQGTTSSRAVVFDKNGDIVSVSQKEFTQIFPKSGSYGNMGMSKWSNERSY